MGTGVYVREVSVYEIDGGERKKPQEVFMEGNISYITYGKNEKEIVKKGIDEIRQVLMGGSVNEKLSLLLALDWFMDPYYKQDSYIADIREELADLLQTVIIASNEDEVSEDALNLLVSYEWPPFKILEDNIENVSERLKPYVLEALHPPGPLL